MSPGQRPTPTPAWSHPLRAGVHALRRAAARRSLRAAGRVPGTVLFLCVGNLYRSPFAAGLFRGAMPPGFGVERVDSAGLVHLERPSPPAAVEVAAARGVDLEGHRGARLDPGQALAVELIVVMEAGHRRVLQDRFGRLPRGVLVLGDLDPEFPRTRDIPDPQDRSRSVLEGSYTRIERCIHELIRVLSELPGPRPGG